MRRKRMNPFHNPKILNETSNKTFIALQEPIRQNVSCSLGLTLIRNRSLKVNVHVRCVQGRIIVFKF